MNYLDYIERKFSEAIAASSGPGKSLAITVDFQEVEDSGVRVAGHLNEPMADQIIAWAKGKGWSAQVGRTPDTVDIWWSSSATPKRSV